MNRKIEAGCLVMVHGLVGNHHLNGSVGTVKGYYQAGTYRTSIKNVGCVNEESAWIVEQDHVMHGWNPYNEENLMRIDDPDLEDVDQEIGETVDV